MSKNETPVTFFYWTSIYLLDKTIVKFKISIFWLAGTKFADFFLGWIGNQESLSPQTFHGPSVSGQESPVSFFCWSNLSFSRNQPMKFKILTVKFLPAGKKVQISNFIGWYCLKEKLFEKQMDTSVSCPDTERLWKVSAKSESWFPIQRTKKLWNFFEQVKRPKSQILSLGFV